MAFNQSYKEMQSSGSSVTYIYLTRRIHCRKYNINKCNALTFSRVMTLSSNYGSLYNCCNTIGNKSLELLELLTTQFLDEKVATMIGKRDGNPK